MQQFKIEDFAQDYPEIAFPWHRTLSEEECMTIVAQLKANFALPKDCEVRMLVNEIDRRSCPIPDLNLDNKDVSIGDLFKRLKMSAPEVILVNWGLFEEIDAMKTEEFERYLQDLWYPPEDIDFFPENIAWLFSLDHEGHVRFLSFS